MRILVYEHFTALGTRAPLSLRAEGGAMLAALATDLAAAGHRVVTFAGPGGDPAWPAPLEEAGVRVERGQRDSGLAQGAVDSVIFPDLLAEVEAAWVVAPETGGVLESLSRIVLAAGRRILGSAPDAVALAASKLATCRALSARRVRAVPTLPLAAAGLPAGARAWGFPLVVKPDDGVGSEGVSLVSSVAGLAAGRRRAARHSRSVVVQPYVEGRHASASLLVGPADAFPLALQGQDVRVGARFSYRGGEVPLATPADGPALALARAACAAIPGLAGFVGVDLVLAAGGPAVIEVNPRLTTAYLGLRRACGVNVAALALGVLDGGSPQAVTIERRVRFTAWGRVTVVPPPGRRVGPRGAVRPPVAADGPLPRARIVAEAPVKGRSDRASGWRRPREVALE